jgi:hypothetical protein
MKIKDLPMGKSLEGVHFRIPGTKVSGYWRSQWGYPDGGAGVWYRKDPKSTQVFPVFLHDLKEALEWEVIDDNAPKAKKRKQTKPETSHDLI